MIKTLAIENYRSLRRLVVPVATLNVVTGANGSGKSSLYRTLRLLAGSSRNGAVAALAREGGLPTAGMADPSLDQPFLTTRELFILKLDQWPTMAQHRVLRISRRHLPRVRVPRRARPSARLSGRRPGSRADPSRES